jgi:hypothetical protein
MLSLHGLPLGLPRTLSRLPLCAPGVADVALALAFTLRVKLQHAPHRTGESNRSMCDDACCDFSGQKIQKQISHIVCLHNLHFKQIYAPQTKIWEFDNGKTKHPFGRVFLRHFARDQIRSYVELVEHIHSYMAFDLPVDVRYLRLYLLARKTMPLHTAVVSVGCTPYTTRSHGG